MIDHIVLVKFGESTTQEQLSEVVTRFKALKPHLTGIVDLQAGLNFSEKNQGYQVVLSVRFEDRAALEAYGPNPQHQEVAAYIREVGRVDSIVVDIEI
ncbi:Stress responsive alpha-beta barrel domain-containing protein [Paenibacillus mucilaginosus 3016]|uniref:Stress responsive alpha-beta barrel domain-containing protein n=2 Tax=Paenibacillus mucilaginosus TaxID=61624 RepID=H6NIC5_9BACL|nr:Dabb family protein [Paenibacillus mucilaginosus]AFC31528.1 Stress responsive alpha-beta barrel domain-containing protein [Paenibacillus mucilaginosus 3016]AFH63872.1 stress protein [Paenibacillus mucilaginosus K02]WFA20069.1 Dabb family protein [Paenibacillus mucilaginosus]